MPVGEVYAASWQSSGAQYPLTRDLPTRHSPALKITKGKISQGKSVTCTLQLTHCSHPQTSFSRIINLKANEVVRGWGFSSPLNLNLNLNFCPSSQNLERRNAESGREFVFCIFGPRAAVLADGKVRSP